jgi:hypothetical protein
MSLPKTFSCLRSVIADEAFFGFDSEAVSIANRNFNPPSNKSYLEVFIIPVDTEVKTLGSNGHDRFTGILQINLNYPLANGEGEAVEKAEDIRKFFAAGSKFAYENQVVIVRICKVNNGFVRDGFFVTPLSIEFYSDLSR